MTPTTKRVYGWLHRGGVEVGKGKRKVTKWCSNIRGEKTMALEDAVKLMRELEGER